MIIEQEKSLTEVDKVIKVLFSEVVSLNNSLQDFDSETSGFDESQGSLGEVTQ